MAVQPARLCIISREPLRSGHFIAALRAALGPEDHVEIIIDRRRGKRRQGAPHIQQERRRAKILEVVIEADPPTASGPPGGDSGG